MIKPSKNQKYWVEQIKLHLLNKKQQDEVLEEFETYEELSNYIGKYIIDIKKDRAKSKANMSYNRNTSYGSTGWNMAYGKTLHTGSCKSYKNKEEYEKSKGVK